MKFFALLILIISAASAFSQIDSTAVGDSSIVYKYKNSEMYTCSSYHDTCYYGTIGVSELKDPFYDSPYSRGVSFKPNVGGEFIDTCVVVSGWRYNSLPQCNWTPCYNNREYTRDTIIVKGTAYYDNRIKLSYGKDAYYGNVYFSVDTTGEKYTSYKRYTNFTVFNNTDEEIICTEPKIDVNDSSLIHMDMYKNGIISTLVVPPHSYNAASLEFSTKATPANTEKKYVGQISIPFQGSAMDSVLLRPITLTFERKPIFKWINHRKYQIYIYPNPAHSATISCHIPGSIDESVQPVQLSIFDVFGNKRITFLDGNVDSKDYHFAVDLPIGLYFVRFVTPEGTQTLNLISMQ